MRIQALYKLATAIAVLTLVPAHAWADEDEAKGKSGGSETGDPLVVAAMPVFVPKNRGAPMMRLGGATRSAGAGLRVEALVPEEAGWTLQEQPVVYWYASEPTTQSVELVVRRIQKGEDIARTKIPSPTEGGIQRLALGDHGVKLAAGETYLWRVHVIVDESDRSRDKIVGGGIERIELSSDVAATVSSAEGGARAYALADQGIWYDAIDDLTGRIAENPGDRELWNQRAALLEQVGLPKFPLPESAAAGFEKR